MRFRPKANDRLTLNSIEYSFAPHPHALSLAHGQEGGRATVYRLNAASNTLYETKALKVFKDQYRIPQIGEISDKLAQYASISGLGVCHREVLRPDQYNRPPLGEEDLKWAVLMPWVEGNTWYDILAEKSEIDLVTMRVVVQKYLDVLLDLERNAVTHCDLSPANILVRLWPSPEVNLIDVEEICALGIPAPEMLPRGTAGYAHRSAHLGLWHPFADRFAGALLLCEMVCWSDATFRESAAGDSFFDATEIHNTSCQRYRIMVQTLEKVGGSRLVDLFQRCWVSTDLTQAPAFWEWSAGLSQYFNNKVMISQPPNSAYLQQQIVYVMRQLTHKRMKSVPEEQVELDHILAMLQRQLEGDAQQEQLKPVITTSPQHSKQKVSQSASSERVTSVTIPQKESVKTSSGRTVQSRTQHGHITKSPQGTLEHIFPRLSLKQKLMFLGSTLMLVGIIAVTSAVVQSIKTYITTPQTNAFLERFNTGGEPINVMMEQPTLQPTAPVASATPVPPTAPVASATPVPPTAPVASATPVPPTATIVLIANAQSTLNAEYTMQWSQKNYYQHIFALGDVNGDNMSDIGTFDDNGQVQIWFGGSNGLATVSSQSAYFLEDQGSMTPLCDVNNDSFDDVLINEVKGDSWFVPGSTDGLQFDQRQKIATGGWFTLTNTCFGDVTGDGIADAVILSNTDIQVRSGGDEFPSVLTAQSTLCSTALLSQGLCNIGVAGDVNGDNVNDIAMVRSISGERKIEIYEGAASDIFVNPPLSTSVGVPGYDNQYFASTMHSIGDVNRDGYADLGVAQYWDGVMLYLGSANGISPYPDWMVTGFDAGVVASAGDINDDGYDDLYVGSPWQATARIFLGDATTLAKQPVWIEQDDGHFGWPGGDAGDIDGNGKNDIFVGAHYNNGTAKVFLFR